MREGMTVVDGGEGEKLIKPLFVVYEFKILFA